MMADGYVSMLQLFGMAMMVAIRAALIPSSSSAHLHRHRLVRAFR